MANMIFTNFLELMADNDLDWETVVLRALLERSTSSYTPDKDHDFLDDFTTGGGIEITVAAYARQTLASAAAAEDAANDRVEFDCDNIAFGNLEAGQTVLSIIIYQQVGGDDTTPANDPLIARIDTDSGALLPVALAGGAFNITINAEGLIQLAQA